MTVVIRQIDFNLVWLLREALGRQFALRSLGAGASIDHGGVGLPGDRFDFLAQA